MCLCGRCCSFPLVYEANQTFSWCEHVFNFVSRFEFLLQNKLKLTYAVSEQSEKMMHETIPETNRQIKIEEHDEYKIEETRRHGKAQHTTSRQMAMGAENRRKFIPFVVVKKCAEAEPCMPYIDPFARRFMCFETFLRKVNLWGPNDNSLSQSSNQSVDIWRSMMVHQDVNSPIRSDSLPFSIVPHSRALRNKTIYFVQQKHSAIVHTDERARTVE